MKRQRRTEKTENKEKIIMSKFIKKKKNSIIEKIELNNINLINTVACEIFISFHLHFIVGDEWVLLYPSRMTFGVI